MKSFSENFLYFKIAKIGKKVVDEKRRQNEGGILFLHTKLYYDTLLLMELSKCKTKDQLFGK